MINLENKVVAAAFSGPLLLRNLPLQDSCCCWWLVGVMHVTRARFTTADTEPRTRGGHNVRYHVVGCSHSAGTGSPGRASP